MGRVVRRMAALGLTAFLVLVSVPTVAAAGTVSLSTPYPGVAVAPGTKVSFDISVKTDESARVDLSLKGVPADWTASLFGGGFVVDGVQTNGTTAATVRLDVTVPADRDRRDPADRGRRPGRGARPTRSRSTSG